MKMDSFLLKSEIFLKFKNSLIRNSRFIKYDENINFEDEIEKNL